MRRWSPILISLISAIAALVVVYINYKNLVDKSVMSYALVTGVIAWIVSAIIIWLGISHNMHKEKREFEYREYLLNELNPSRTNEDPKEGRKENKNENNKTDKIYEENTRESEKTDKKDIIVLMLKNTDETKEYFKISKNQAKSSFWFSIVACIVGIVMISISLYGVFKIKDTQFAIIGIVGGAITELIAGTVLVIHNKSALQLNYYYDALHENEKFLSAINLADKLEDDDKRDMYIEIIMAQIQSAKDYKKTNY